MPNYTDENMHKRPQPKILSMEDAKKLAEYDGLVAMNNALLARMDGIVSLFQMEGMSYSADSLEKFLKEIK